MAVVDRTVIRAAAVSALIAAATAAGNNVFSPDDWPTTAPNYPLIVVRTPRERKENSAPRFGNPQFFSTITLTATGRVQAGTEMAAESAIEAFSEQIETALLTNAQFISANLIQQFSSVETTMTVNAEADTHIGETVVTFEIEVPQLYEMTIDAAGIPVGQPLTEIQGTVPNPNQSGTQPLGKFDLQSLETDS